MIGDKLKYFKTYQPTTQAIISTLKANVKQQRFCIAIAGESGSGKTSLAFALKVDIEQQWGLKGYMFQGDDYFKLPPKTNHNQRVKNISNVGVNEVDLTLLNTHIESFLHPKHTITKPLVDYSADSINTEIIHPKHFDFCIVEGTYAMLLNAPHYKVFINKTFNDTLEQRKRRGRDVLDTFGEQVLEIEHKIIKAHAVHANLIV